MNSLLVFALGAGVSQCVLSIFVLLRHGRLSIQKYLFIALMLAVVGYLLHPLLSDPTLLQFTSLIQTAVPGLFWLLTGSLFIDDFRLSSWRMALVLITVLFPLPFALFSQENSFALIMLSAGQVLEFILLFFALVAVARHWQTDLVESRRGLRIWFCGLVGIYLLVLLSAREVFFSDASWLMSVQYLSAAVFLLLINLLLLKPVAELWSRQSSAIVLVKQAVENGVIEAEAELDPVLLENVQQLLATERVYRQMGLTIGQLAVQLDVPEYKLRRTINIGLGYRNFNDFLNRFRVIEAAEQLTTERDTELPVLTIALDVGFRSLSSFNKAFKDHFNLTPTEYRKTKQAA